LTDAKLRAEYPASAFIRPNFQYGDILVFGGNMIHRTSSTAKMNRYRTSLGVRIFTEIPERCKADRFIQL
jgi:hypothetical protein